jgi:hypothetical protein
MKIIETGLEFEESLLEVQEKVDSILIAHGRVEFSTIFDSHMEGIMAGKGGCDCNFFIDRQGNIYKGRDPKYKNSILNNSIVILLEGNLDAKPMTKEQEESLMNLSKELKKEFKFENVILNENVSGGHFPFEKFKSELKNSEAKIEEKPSEKEKKSEKRKNK